MPANASHIGEKEMKLEESAYVYVIITFMGRYLSCSETKKGLINSGS